MNRLVAGAIAAATLSAAPYIPASLVTVPTHAASKLYAPAQSVTPDQIVATARRYLGSPYAIIGDSPSTGFSCIGFVHFVFAQNGISVPYDIPMAWQSAPHVAFSDLMPGDVLFYSNTVFAGLSHVAIYIGNGQMIGADNFTVGVTIDNVNDKYWVAHYTGATRPLAATGTVSAPQAAEATDTATATPVPSVAASAPAGTRLQPLSAQVGVYSGPGYQYTALGTLAPDTVLTVVQGQAGWYDVQFHDAHMGDAFGWVNAAAVAPAGSQHQPEAPATAIATATPRPSPTPQASPTQQFSRAAAVSDTAAGPSLVVVAGPLYVRSGPGKQYASIGFVLRGAHLVLLGERPDWAHIVTPNGLKGWVARQYVAPESTTQQHLSPTSAVTQHARPSAGKPARGTGRVIASVLNVRSAPSEHAHVISVLFAGEVVPILVRAHDWDEVRLHRGVVGWVSAKWLATT